MSALSDLNTKDRIFGRDLAMQAAYLGLKNASALHYTEESLRWYGILHQCRAWKGEFPLYADCSAFVSWCLWCALTHFPQSHKDIVNGENWTGGYTGTGLTHGESVLHSKTGLQRADVVYYGVKGTTGEHEAIYVGGGKVISNGSEPGPFLLDMNYRNDMMDVRRYI